MTLENSKGQVFYGLHFYSGLAEYQEPGKDPYRVYLNENTLRSMDPTFAGRPVFVYHVDGVASNLDKLKNDADGWVVESFYNQADGKHWVKFIVVSDDGLRAVKNGMKLSNCYVPKAFSDGGVWNGISYNREITDGEYEHLAIVPNPRYEESVIMTPEQFKSYNEKKLVEINRLANEGKTMKLNFFKKTKVENSIDLAEMSVVLPKSGREVSIAQLVADADGERVISGSDVIENAGKKMTLNDLLEKHKSMNDELEAFKAKEVHMNGDDEDAGEKKDCKNEDDEKEEEKKKKDAKKKNEDEEKEKAEKKKNADDAAAKKAADKVEADKVRNAHKTPQLPTFVELGADKVQRGIARYG